MRYFNKPFEVELLGHKINTCKFCLVPSHIKNIRYAYKQGRKINVKSWTKETIGNNFVLGAEILSYLSFTPSGHVGGVEIHFRVFLPSVLY